MSGTAPDPPPPLRLRPVADIMRSIERARASAAVTAEQVLEEYERERVERLIPAEDKP